MPSSGAAEGGERTRRARRQGDLTTAMAAAASPTLNITSFDMEAAGCAAAAAAAASSRDVDSTSEARDSRRAGSRSDRDAFGSGDTLATASAAKDDGAACPTADSNDSSFCSGGSCPSPLARFSGNERLDGRGRSDLQQPAHRPRPNGDRIIMSLPFSSSPSTSRPTLSSSIHSGTERSHRSPNRLTFDAVVAAAAAAATGDTHRRAAGCSSASSDDDARSSLGSRSSDSGSVSCAASHSSASSPDASVADARSLRRRRRESAFGSSGSESGCSYQQGAAWRQRRAERELIGAYSHPIPEQHSTRRLYFMGRGADDAVVAPATIGDISVQAGGLLLTAEQMQHLRVLESLCNGDDFESIYSLGEVLCHGGPYGSAFAGVDKRDGSHVTVQLVDVGRHLDDLYTLCSELLATSELHHASLADHVGSYFSSRSMRLWLVSELVDDGVSLRRAFSDAPPDDGAAALIARECVRLAQCLQLDAFTHRRLCVDSVYVCADGGVRVCRVGCCSHAWSSSGANLRAGESVHYTAAPEQIKRKSHSPKADSWSVGVLIYELLQGDRPYRDLTEDKALLKTARSGLRKCAREVEASPDVKNFLDRCLRRRQLKRAGIDEVARHPFLRRALICFSNVLLCF